MSVPTGGKTAMQVMQEQARKREMAVDQDARARKMQMDAAAQQAAIARQAPAAARQAKTIFPDPLRATEMNSVTKLQELVPIRVASSRVLDGPWSGQELTGVRVIGSMFGGKHYILQLGHLLRVGQTDTFRVDFVAHMPVKGDLKDPLLVADAERTALAFMHMINMQRVDPSPVTDEAGRAIVTADMLAGKRGGMLIMDELSNIPGKPPKF